MRFILLLALTLALGLSAMLAQAADPKSPPLDAVKNAGLTADRAVAAMTLPPGFKAQLIAAEPDIVQPVAMAIDDRGRLWIAQAMNYPKKAPEGQGKDSILIFESTKGDGHFDQRTVFCTGLNLVSGLEVGFGGVWVGQAPQLLFIPILEGDKPGKAEVLLDGWGIGDTHETLNSFAWGPDGWLYGCQGVFSQCNVGKPGAPDDQRVRLNACIWRYHPKKKTFEIFAEGGSNQWGFDWNDQGQMFMTCCVIPHLYHVFPGGRYQRQAGPHANPYTFADIKTIADHVHWAGASGPHAGNNKSDSAGGGHAHCGAMIYLGDNWPAAYRNQIFMGNIHGNRMNEDVLEARGSGYVGHHGSDLVLMNDKWSRLISEKYGPDGGVYVIDWYDKQACHLPNPEVWDRSNGRIYKITYGDPKPVNVDLVKLSSDELARLATSTNDWYVRHARRILQERGNNPALAASLHELAIHGKDPAERLRGVWALQATGNFDPVNTCRELFQDSDPYVRAWAVELAAAPVDVWPGILSDFKNLAVHDPSPVVRLSLASATQSMKGVQAWERWELVEHLAAHGEDVEDHNLPLMDWYAAEPLVTADVSRAAQLAVDSKIPLVSRFIARRLALMPDDPAAISAAVRIVANVQSDAVRRDAMDGILDGFSGKRRVAMPEGWQATYDKLATSADQDVRQRAGALATIFGDARVLAMLRATLSDSSADAVRRHAALDSLLAANDAPTLPLLQKLIEDPQLSAAVIRGLAAYDSSETPSLLISCYSRLDAASKLAALNTLAARTTWARALIAAVDSNQLPRADLTAPTVRNLSGLEDKSLNEWIAKNWGSVRASDGQKKAEIAKYRKMLTPESVAAADAKNGRAIFSRTCMQCHTLFDAGAKIGPDLTGSNRVDVSYLLENIVDPSAVIGKDYLLTTVRTNDGRTIDGIVKSETAEVVTLASVNGTIALPKIEIARRKTGDVSMMPEGLLATMSEKEVRDLIKYLGSPKQVAN